ncbi:MAG: AsmA-like C-terminal domain-containing protein [Hyphomicrobiales bacterium]|nr:AsmA-like C-terminal domain-containing protein [Hyphomicrobiales bacterium]
MGNRPRRKSSKRRSKKSWLGAWLSRHRIHVRSRRASRIVLETIAGVAIVAGVAVALFAWQLSKGEISVSFLTAPIERAVNAQLGGYTVAIGDTVLEKSDSAAGVSLRLKSLRLHDADGALIGEAPKAAIGLKLMPLLLGRVVAGSIDLIGPRLAVAYEPGGRIAVSLAETPPAPHAAKSPAGRDAPAADAAGAAPSAQQSIRFIKAVLAGEGRNELTGLDAIGIRHATLVFFHERLGRRWEISNGSVVVTRSNGDLQIGAEADIGLGDEIIAVRAQATLSARDDGLHIAGRFDDLVPRLIGQGFDAYAPLRALDLPVSAEFTGDLDDDGTLHAATFTALLGAGRLRPPGVDGPGIPVQEGALHLTYNATSRVIGVEKAELATRQTQITLSGLVTGPGNPLNADDENANSWHYVLEAHDVLLGSSDVAEPPLPVERIGVAGSYDIATGALRLERGELAAGEAVVALSGTVAAAEGSPAVKVSGTFAPMPIRTLKAVWPVFAAPGARDWVAENIRSGEVTGGTFSVNFPPGLLARIEAGGSIPDEALQLDFGFRNLVTSYLGPMPFIRGADGRARIVGDLFALDVDNAHVELASGERLELSGGRFLVPKIADPVPNGEIAVNVTGGVTGLLELLDHEPLGYPGRVGIAPADFSGRGEVALQLDLPLLDDVTLDEVRIGSEAELNELSGAGVFADRDFAEGVLLISVKDETLSAKGEVLVAGRPAGLVWYLPFEQSKSDPARFFVTMTLNDADRREYGLEFPHLTGPVRFQFEPDGALGKGREGETRTHIIADLKQATVTRTPFGWDKPEGVPGELSFVASERRGGGYVLDNFALDSDGTKIRGRVVVAADGDVETVRFAEFVLQPGDEMSLAADRVSKREWHLALKGAVFDARELVDSVTSLNEEADGEAKPADGGPRIVLEAEIDRIVGQEDAYLADARVHLVSASGQISQLDITGRLQGQANFRTVISEAAGSGTRKLRVDADDAGAAFRFSGLYRRAEGGVLQLDMKLPAKEGEATMGLLNAFDFRIQNEPVLTTINQAATTQRGNPQNGVQTAGIRFDRLRMPFERRPGQFKLGESVIRGPSVGATMGGTIDFAEHRIALEGTFIPAYLLNNLLSRVPVLGQILIGGRDEGLVALTFAITGSTSDPQVTVNPLSVVTPGILRKIFNFGQPSVDVGADAAPADPATGELPSRTRPPEIQ